MLKRTGIKKLPFFFFCPFKVEMSIHRFLLQTELMNMYTIGQYEKFVLLLF